MKAMGSLPGASDLVIILGGGRTYWVELKAPESKDLFGNKIRPGRVSKSQEEFRDALLLLGHSYCIVRSQDEFCALLKSLGLLPQLPNHPAAVHPDTR